MQVDSFLSRSPAGRTGGDLVIVSADRQPDEIVYKAHSDELVRFATGLVGPDDAPDVVVDAFLRLTSSKVWAEARDQRSLWFRAVVYEAGSWLRSNDRRSSREQTASLQHTPSPDDLERDDELLDALATLTVQQRAVVVLTYWADLTAADAAELLGISSGSVKKQLSRARRKLRGVLSDDRS